MKTPAEEKERVKNLSKFQYRLLSSALQTPHASVRYVSYSTCSIYREEDEAVIRDVLSKFGDQWEVCPEF